MQMVACYLETVQASRHDNSDSQHHGVYNLDFWLQLASAWVVILHAGDPVCLLSV